MILFVRFIHIFSLIIWIGGMIFFSFIAAPAIFKVLTREAAGDVVGRIFPKYWMMGYLCGAAAIATLFFQSQLESIQILPRLVILIFMYILSLFAGLVIGARAAKIKAELRDVEAAAQKEVLKTRFRKVHAISAVLNGIIIIAGIVLILLTSREYKGL